MPFFTRDPSHYIPVLQDKSTDPLHIGLHLGGNVIQPDGEARAEPATMAEGSWAELALAIQQTSRSIRCLWLRVKLKDFDPGAGNGLLAFQDLGQGLVGATAIESLVLEDQGIDIDQLACLKQYLKMNETMRGIKFLRTHLDTHSSLVLTDFFEGNPALRVLDLTDNPKVDDKTIKGILGAILQNKRCRLETLNIFEALEDEEGANAMITENGVDFIASFASQTQSLSTIRLRIRELSNRGLQKLASSIKTEHCKIARLEISGRFGDEGVSSIAEALTTNQSIRIIDIGMSEHLTDVGGQSILRVVQGEDNSWQSKVASNHTLQHVYISEGAGSGMSKSLMTKLQSITSVDPRRTLQMKAWDYIDRHIEDLSSLGLEVKLAPYLLSFVSHRGGIDSMFRFMHMRHNAPELFSNPTPERIRLTPQMEKVKQQNKVLRALLESERGVSQSIRSENIQLRNLGEDEQHQRNAMGRCLLLPLFKAFEWCRHLMDLLKELHS